MSRGNGFEREGVSGRVLHRWLSGGVVFAVLFGFGLVFGEEPNIAGQDQEVTDGTEAAQTDLTDGPEEVPLEWIEEILANQEILESLELLDKLELFEGEDRFSPHHFD